MPTLCEDREQAPGGLETEEGKESEKGPVGKEQISQDGGGQALSPHILSPSPPRSVNNDFAWLCNSRDHS